MAVAILLAGCDGTAAPPPADQAVRPARLLEVQATPVRRVHEFVGRVEAARTVDVSFEVPGPLAEFPVREGETVPAGALVAALEPTDFALALREAEVQLDLARRDLARKRSLLDQRGISEALVDDAEALVALREVRLAQAREALADSRILAPFTAYVARRFVDAPVNLAADTPVVRLHDLATLTVVARVPEHLLATVDPERVEAITARFDFVPNRSFPLEVRENRGEADGVAQSFEVTFSMPRPEDLNILPGMTATVQVTLAMADQPLITIPAGALTAAPDGSFRIWVVDPETRLVRPRPVEVGPISAAGVAIVEGLTVGETVVAAGAGHLQPGMRVRPLP